MEILFNSEEDEAHQNVRMGGTFLTRDISQPPARPTIIDTRPGKVVKRYKIRVVTPIVGGGPKARINDPITPIRGQSVRGHLRFWWRATRGNSFSNYEDLRAAETEVWGDTEKPSPVDVGVSIDTPLPNNTRVQLATEMKKGLYRVKKEYPAYALFPLTSPPKEMTNSEKNESVRGRVNFYFTLKLVYPEELEKDVQSSMWAWVNFGGIGSRTRRGCGALYSKEFAPASSTGTVEDLKNWFKKWVNECEFTPDENNKDWPTIRPWFSVFVDPDEVEKVFTEPHFDAWNNIIGTLEQFRQGPDFGRDPGRGPRNGRSRWPEAESIRNITGDRDSKHRNQNFMPTPGFPRAAFGLPIIFHFKDKWDPRDTEIRPLHKNKRYNRMASPLILKPLAISNESSIELSLVLSTPRLTDVYIEGGRNLPRVVEHPNFGTYRDSPLEGYTNRGSALEAFVNILEEDFRRVKL
ncbi:MAG: type III-B CRISPR module RAMP protein Cmr1 [Promethearchaeota archaeon]